MVVELIKLVRSSHYDAAVYKPGALANVIRQYSDTLGRRLYRVTMLDDGRECVLLETDFKVISED